MLEPIPRDDVLARRAALFLYTRGVCGEEQVVVQAANGWVILCGQVPSHEAKNACLECCRHVAGVVRVVDQLSVGSRPVRN